MLTTSWGFMFRGLITFLLFYAAYCVGPVCAAEENQSPRAVTDQVELTCRDNKTIRVLYNDEDPDGIVSK